MKTEKINIDLPEIVGKGYGSFWRDKSRYRVCKGGRGSKKSRTMALWVIYKMMEHPKSNTLVVRQTYNTHKDSTFAVLKWAITRLQVEHLWSYKESPLEMTYKPTGQRIIFRGFDDVLKLTSITVPVGVLCWAWIEEAFELEDEAEFRTLDESIRGDMPDGLWKQITLTYNPWVNSHWTKTRFWDNTDPQSFTLTTTYHCNEWLDDSDKELIEQLQNTDPERYKVVGLGEYGIPGGAFFDEFRRDIHVTEPFEIPDHWTRYRSMDYGLDKLAVLWYAVDPRNNIWVYKELHESDHIVSKASARIIEVNNGDNIRQTYAPPDLWSRSKDTGQSIAETFGKNGVVLYQAGNKRIPGWLAVKEGLAVEETKDPITGQPLKVAKVRVFSNCRKLIEYLPQIQRDEKDPNDCADNPHEVTHICDALRYFLVMRYNKHQAKEEPQDPDALTYQQRVHKTYGSGKNARMLTKWG